MGEERPVDGDRLRAAAARARPALDHGRSDTLLRLFDFLLESSAEGRAPKEAEIAHVVFGKDSHDDFTQDASVRVHIHRLRRKLEAIAAASSGDTVTLPLGDYRLTIKANADIAAAEQEPISIRLSARRPYRFLVCALALLIILNAIGWLGYILWFRDASPSASHSAFWRVLSEGAPYPTFIIAGDYYIFGDTDGRSDVSRLIRDFQINSRDDLDDCLMSHPAEEGRYADLDLHYLPSSAAAALVGLAPVVSGALAPASGKPFVVTTSETRAEILKHANIVYVGFLSSLGVLRDPVFEASGFSVGDSFDELIDRATGRRFMSDWGRRTENRLPRRDYAYVASLPGPDNNHILIIAGTRDAGVKRAVQVATDPSELAQLVARSGNATAFEGLYEVSTLGNTDLGSSLVIARPLRLSGVWRAGQKAPLGQLPDQLPTHVLTH